MKIVIGFSGRAGAGKSTAAAMLVARGFVLLPFAAPLKRMARAYGLSAEEIGPGKEAAFARDLPDLDLATAARMLACLPQSIRWQASPDSLVAWFNEHRAIFTTPRRFLQYLGTEWGRQRLGEMFWVECWRAEMGDSAAGHFGPLLFVVDDCRFENEAAAIRAEGGTVIEIRNAAAGSASGAAHASEGGVAADFVIVNEADQPGWRDALAAQVDGVLNRLVSSEAW